MSDYKKVFTDIYENYGFGGEESRSGPGSGLGDTAFIRKKIVREMDDIRRYLKN